MEAVFNLREAVVASALEQVGLLNSELASGTAERFKLVAAAARERSQQRNILYHQTSLLDDKVKRAEALAATQVAQLKHYEATCAKLDKRIQQLEALLKSEHEVADLKIKQLTGELQRYRLASSPTFNSPASTCAVARSEEAKVQTAS
jgi:hypothetical protein